MIKQKKLVPNRRFEGFNDKWTLTELGEVADFFNNMRIPIDTQKRTKGIYPYYGATGVIDYINDYIFEGEYVLLAEDGENILSRNSPLVYLTKGKFWVNNHAHVLSMKSGSNLFLIQLLEKQDYEKYNSGTAQPKLNGEVVRNMGFHFPIIEEQQKIGEFFKHLDEMIALEQRKVDKTKSLKSAYLAEMFPAEGERVPKRRFAGFTEEWESKKIIDVVTKISDGDWILKEHIFDKGKYRIIQTGNLGIGNFVDREKNAKYFNENDFNHLNANEIFPGDILISRLAEPAGRTIILPETGFRMVTSVDIAIVRPNITFDSQFLMTLMNSKEILSVINKEVTGTTHKRISRKNLEEINLIVPKISEQQKIGEFFNKLDNRIMNHQNKLEKLKATKQAYLHEMFV